MKKHQVTYPRTKTAANEELRPRLVTAANDDRDMPFLMMQQHLVVVLQDRPGVVYARCLLQSMQYTQHAHHSFSHELSKHVSR